MPASPIRVAELCFSWPDGTPVFDRLGFTLGAVRTGLVAPNGAGKSTLLRLLAGELQPSSGTVEVEGTIGYLPQHLPLTGQARVSGALGVTAQLAALHALAGGRGDAALLERIGDDWDVEDRSRAALERLGLGSVALDRPLSTLSGGEVMALGLAGQLLRSPDVLLLDEPTNNLDRAARARLHAVIDDWRGCLLVASHDREMLERMDQIGELHPSALRLYGGGLSFYQQAVHTEQTAAERQVQAQRLAVKREQREMQQAHERTERRQGNARRNLDSAGLPRILIGTRKRAAQESAGKSRGTHGARIDAARERLDEARQALRETPDLRLTLPATRVPAGRRVLEAEHVQLTVGSRPLFTPPGVDLVIQGPERIALLGTNGAGKSTLMRLFSGALTPDSGSIRRGEGRVAYLSQRLDLLDEDRTVAENFAAFTPTLVDRERADLLARWLFRGDRRHLPVRSLSGGERLRAILACVLHAEPAPQLLLLDEPTNNLDMDATAELEEALQAYEGALVVVSHDERFLQAIGLTRRLELVDGLLRQSDK